MAQRSLELILKVTNEASAELARIRDELQQTIGASVEIKSGASVGKAADDIKNVGASAEQSSQQVDKFSQSSQNASEQVGIFGRILQGLQAAFAPIVGGLTLLGNAVGAIIRILPKLIGLLSLLPESNKLFQAGFDAAAKAADNLNVKLQNLAKQTSNPFFAQGAGLLGQITQNFSKASTAAGGFVGALPPATIRAAAVALGLVSPQLAAIVSGTEQAGTAATNSKKSVADLAFSFNNLVTAGGTLINAFKPFYDFTIGASERLNAQLLSSQTNLAASSRIFQGGVEITDPTEKINASRGALEAALKQIEKDTRSLVGVTSQEVNELFQITLTNAAELNNQSKQFPGPIEAATSLTKGWAASLKVIGVPLDQARQEINSILKGQIDNNSIIAKNLNLTNSQVQQYKAQGTLVDELNKRLETFVAGNAIAANSIDGVFSNIKDIVEVIGREAGAPLLEPIIAGLNQVFSLLDKNQENINNLAKGLAQGLIGAFSAISAPIDQVFQGISGTVGKVFGDIFASLTQIPKAIQDGFKGVGIGDSLTPVIASFNQVFESIGVAATQFISDILPSITSGIQALLPIFATLGSVAGGAFTFLGNVAKGFFGLISAALPGIISAVKNLTPAFSQLGELVNSALGLIGSTFANYADDIGQLVGSIANALSGVLAPVFSVIAGAVTGLIKVFDALINNPISQFLIGVLVDGFSLLFDAIGKVGAAVGILVSGAFNVLIGVGEAVFNVFATIQQAIASVIGIAEPFLTVFGAIGKALFAFVGAQVGAQIQAIGSAFAEVGDILSAIVAPAVELVSDLFLGIKQSFADAGESFSGFREALFNAVIGSVEQIIANPVFDVLAKVLRIDTNAIKAGLETLRNELKTTENSAEQTAKKTGAIGDKTGDAAKKAADDLKILPPSLRELGTSFEQLKDKADNALRSVASEGGGDPERFKKAAQELIDLTQQQVELGQISAEEAQKRLSQLASNTKLEVDIQQKAQDSITKVRKAELDKQVNDINTQISEVEAAAANGTISEVKAAEETTRLRKEQLDIQLADLQDSIDREQEAIEQGRGSSKRLQELQNQQRKLQADREKTVIDGEKRIQQARINEIQKAEDKAIEVAKNAEIARSIETQKLINANLITREEADQKRLESAKKTIEAELAAEKASLAALEKLPKGASPELERERQKQISASRQKTSELTLRLLENEKAQQEALTRVIQARIDKQLKGTLNAYTAETQALQRQLQLQESLSRTLENQQKLLDARKSLQQAAASAQQSQFSNAIRLLESQFAEEDRITESKKRRKELEERAGAGDSAAAEELKALDKQEARQKQLSQLKIQAKAAELRAAVQAAALERQSLELEFAKIKALQQQEQIKLNIQEIEAKAATAQAVADFAKTKADKSATPEALEAARLQVEAAQQRQVGVGQQQQLFNQTAGQQDLLNQLKQQIQQSQSQQTISNLEADLATLTPDTKDDKRLQQQQLAAAQATPAQFQRIDQQLAQLQKQQPAITQEAPQIIFAKQADLLQQAVVELQKLNAQSATQKSGQTTVQVNQQVSGQIDPNQAATIAAKRVTSDISKALQLVK